MRAKNCTAPRMAANSSRMGRFSRPAHRLAPLALVIIALSGCKLMSAGQTIAPDITGSIGRPATADNFEQLRARHLAHPDDRDAAIAFAKSLRQHGEAGQAAAVMEKIAIGRPRDRVTLAAYGKALIDAGALERARAVLDGADTPDAPDWSVVNARGVIADRLDDHAAAQAFYRQALLLAPGEASVLSNYGLSLLLSHDVAGAEKYLTAATQSPRADDRMRANLALVQGFAQPPSKAPTSRQALKTTAETPPARRPKPQASRAPDAINRPASRSAPAGAAKPDGAT